MTWRKPGQHSMRYGSSRRPRAAACTGASTATGTGTGTGTGNTNTAAGKGHAWKSRGVPRRQRVGHSAQRGRGACGQHSQPRHAEKERRRRRGGSRKRTNNSCRVLRSRQSGRRLRRRQPRRQPTRRPRGCGGQPRGCSWRHVDGTQPGRQTKGRWSDVCSRRGALTADLRRRQRLHSGR